MTRAEIERRLQEIFDETALREREAGAAAAPDAAAIARTRLAVLEEEKRSLEGHLAALDQGEALN